MLPAAVKTCGCRAEIAILSSPPLSGGGVGTLIQMQPNPYQRIAQSLSIADVVAQSVATNDLLPPRAEDKVGGELGKRFSEHLTRELENGRYDPVPAHIISVPKSQLTTRPAALMSLPDRVVYEAIVSTLRSRVDVFLLGDGIVFWPRGDLSSKKEWLKFQQSVLTTDGRYIVCCDIAGFYESIDHSLLADTIVKATGYRDAADALVHLLHRVMGRNRGLPQGLSSSDTLATAFLAELDSAMIRHGFRYLRHGDDVRVSVDNYKQGCRAVRNMEQALRECGLLLNTEKTRVLRRSTYESSLSSYAKLWEVAKDNVRECLLEKLNENIEEVLTAMARTYLNNKAA